MKTTTCMKRLLIALLILMGITAKAQAAERTYSFLVPIRNAWTPINNELRKSILNEITARISNGSVSYYSFSSQEYESSGGDWRLDLNFCLGFQNKDNFENSKASIQRLIEGNNYAAVVDGCL